MTQQQLDQGSWNGKVYGRREYNSCNIYLNKAKVEISNEDADLLEAMNYVPVYNRKEVKEVIESPVMSCTFPSRRKTSKAVNNSVRGDYVKKNSFYEDEFNAALGMRG